MDQQPKYNRILGYQPESNRAIFKLAPEQYGSVAVINCARESWQNPYMAEFTKVKQSQWQSGRSIRMNLLGDQGPPITGDIVFPDTPPDADWVKYTPRGVNHRNCMWFDVEIDKQYLDDIAATHVDIILRGNIADNMIYSTIWWPVSGESGPGSWGPNTVFSTTQPENPLNPDNGGPTIWIQTIEENPEDPTGQPNKLNVPIAIWSYSVPVSYTIDPQGNQTVSAWDWELIYGTSDSQGLYNTTTLNNIPTYVFNSEKQCRFVVQVHWNQNFAHTAIDREVALYVFKGDTDDARALNDYIVKSPIVRMRNQANPGPPAPGEPYMKGFVPAIDLPYYSAPGSKNLSLPITNTEIVMDIMPGTAMIDPNDEYEDAVFIDVIGEDATLTLYYGAGTEAWVMAPTGSGNFPYYIGDRTQLPITGEVIQIPTEEAGFLQLTGAGRYAIYGASALLPLTPEIIQWCDDNNFPTPDYQPRGIITQHPTDGMLANTRGLTNITNWADIMLASGLRMFRNVTGDFSLPEYQTLTNLTETFANTPDFTDPADAMKTWIVNSVTQAEGTFDGATVFNSDITSWYMGNVTTMRRMFKNATQFNQDLGEWDVSNVVYNGMIDMFMGAGIYDQFLAKWDVSNIPNKPPGFDTGTTPDWEEFEKPWWGAANRPITSEHVMFDTIKPGLVIRPEGPGSSIQVFDINQLSSGYKGTFTDLQSCICGVGLIAVFGYADSIRLYNKNITDKFNKDVVTHYSEFNYIHTGFNAEGDFNGQELSSINHITSDNVLSDIDRHITFTGDAEALRALSLDNLFGSAHRFGNWHDIFGGISNNGFWALGRLPDGLPEDLKFGWSDNPDPENYLNRAFSQTSNIPDPSQWEFKHTDSEPNLYRLMAYNDMTEDLYQILNTIISKHSVASHEEIFWGSDLSLGGGIDFTNTTHQITNLSGAYSHAILDNTRNQTQLTDCDLSMCSSYDEIFLDARSTTLTFVNELKLLFAPGSTLRYAFAKTNCVPINCSTMPFTAGLNYWDFTDVTDISGMFFNSVFPETLDNWDLSKLDTEITYDRGHANMPCQSHTYVFTGCSGSPDSMINWRLPPPKGMISETSFNPLGNDRKHGEWYVLDSRYTDTVVYHDVLLPWWFAGCSDFNTDISDWQTTPITHDEPIQSVRLGTFAYATNFNRQIDWYYPDQDFYDLEFIRKNTHQYQTNLPASIWLKTRLKMHLNPEILKLDSVEYGKGAHKHTWWHTFLGAEAYNNGDQDLPIMCANDMVDTFRLSGIDSNITIRKPVWGHAYYQGVFRDTQAWTGTKVIDFECQNRSETPDLTNIYYHSIFADRMFRDSNFGGTLGSGFKWFWFNITNIAGTLKMKTGIDREYSGWNNLSQRNGTDATDISTTQLGTLRAPVGNVTDTDSDIEADTNANLNQGYQGVGCINNSALYDTTRPPQQVRKMYQYCIGRPWYKTDVSSQVDIYELTHTYAARSDVERDNLSEMFMNATEFTQDLSAMWTRWTPPSGAFTDTQGRPWDSTSEANEWFGSNYPSTVRSFNGRNQQRGEVSNNVYPVYGIGDIQRAYEFTCDYDPATKYDPYRVNVYNDWNLDNCDTQPTQFENYELVPGIKFGCQPEETGSYDDIINPGQTYNFTATVGPEPNSRAYNNQPKLGYAVYRSLQTSKILVFQAYTQTISNPSSTTQTFQLFPWWLVLDNLTVPHTSWQEGTEFTATVVNKIKAYDYPWILVKEDQPIIDNRVPEQEFHEVLLENGHRYNNYLGDFSPRKTETNMMLYIDQYAKLDQFDYASKGKFIPISASDFAPHEDHIPDELWHGVMTQPKNFATGATNFTSDKWPVWMTGISDTPMSTPEIQEFLDPDTVRPVGATKYITCYPWVNEPYNWPTASWYQDGTY